MTELLKHLFETYKIDSGDIKRKSGSRKILTETDLVVELGIFADGADIEVTKAERLGIIKDWREKMEELKARPKDNIVIEFISKTFIEEDIAINAQNQYYQEGIQIEEFDVQTILESKMFDWNRSNPDSKISAPELKANLKEIGRRKAFEIRKELIERLTYNEAAKIEEWLKLSHQTLKIVESYEIYSTMVKHWVWMVKRKMLTRSTKNQFVLNFYGKPSCGKSFFVKLMTSPLADFRHNNSDLNSIQDERSIPALGNNFVHFLDELCTGTTKTISSDQELAKIKNIITADTPFKFRPMGTNNEQIITPKTSLIAASNFHIFDVIMDSSGMRRWFEFNVGLESNKYDKELFEKLRETIFDLWVGVNEDIEDGYLDVNSEIGKTIYNIQETYVRKDSFDLWLESVEFVPGSMKGPEAHQLYKEYCLTEGMEHKTKAIHSFYSRLHSIGVEKYMKSGYTYVKTKIQPKAINHTQNEEVKFETLTVKERKAIVGLS